MQIRSKNREGNKVLLEVEEDYSIFEQFMEKALIEAGKEINIPGFRPGKAPKEMVERAVNRDVLETRAAQNLISDLYPKLIVETEIDPVDYPSVEILQQEGGKPFVFKIAVDVYPEVKLGRYKKLKVEKKEAKITEEDVLKVLGNLQERFAKTGPDGKKELLPLDDEFAKKISRHGTMAELKEEIREAMLKERVAETEGEVKNKLLAAAAGEAKIDIPNGMIEREIDIMLDEFRSSLAGSGLSLEDYLKGIKKEEKTFRDELRKSAEVRVRGKIVLRAIAEAEKMTVTDEEVEGEVKSLAEASGQSVEDLKKGLSDGSRKYIEDYMLRRKALEFLVENAQIKSLDSSR